MEKKLDEDDLRDVEKKLKNAKFNKATWKTLGSELGLYRTTLANIEASARGDVESCFTECLTKWLMRVDDVDSHGKPTYNSLIAALKQMEETKNVVDALIEAIQSQKQPPKQDGNKKKSDEPQAKADQTSGHQGPEENGHDETDSGSQDRAKKKSDEPQGGYQYILSKAKQQKWIILALIVVTAVVSTCNKWIILALLIVVMAVVFAAVYLPKGSESNNHVHQPSSSTSLSTTTSTTATSQVPTAIPPDPPQPTATQTNPNELNVGDVKKVLKVLKEAMFGPAQWRSLGLSLGLIVSTLDVIGRTNGNANDYLEQTIQHWLMGEDQVTGKTWQILKEAVKSTGDNAAAERIPGIVKKHN